MNDITILHLSDLHIDKSGNSYSRLLRNLISDIGKEIKKVKNNSMILIVTGDILHQAPKYSDNTKAYEHALKFFNDLYSVIKDKVVTVYIVAGNHDKYRSENNKFLIPSYRTMDNECIIKEKQYASKFDENFYQSFWKYHINTYTKEEGSGFLELIREIYKIFGMSDEIIATKSFVDETFGVDLIEINNRRYCFVLLNTSWSCIDDNDNRNIILGQFQIDKLRAQHHDLVNQTIESDGPDLTIVLGHHPLSSLRGKEEDKIFTEMISFDGFDANVYLSGHTHDRTVTNWINNRHSLNTFVTGIGWPENSGGYHVGGDHTYSMYIFNLNANSVDVYVRSTNDGGVFSPDFRIYTNQQDADRKKLIFPIRAQNAQTYIPLSVGDNNSPKAYYISNGFMEYIKSYFKKIEHLRTLMGMMIEQEKIDFYDNIFADEDEYEKNESTDEMLYNYLFTSFSDDYKEIPEPIALFFQKNQTIIFNMFLSFLQKICQKMQQVLVEDICQKDDIVRFHFRYLSDKNNFQYLRLCISFPKDSDFENNDVSEIKYGQLIEKSYESGNSLIYSVNKEFVQNELNEKWKNFITVVPLFSKNNYTRKYANKPKSFPFITFGVTTNNDRFDELLYCMDYFSIRDTIGEIIEQYLDLFNVNLDAFCTWLKTALERCEYDEQ